MTCLHAGEVFDWTPPPTSPPVALLVRSLSLLLLVVWWFFGRSLSVASRFRAFSGFCFFSPLCMPLSPDEANFKQWLESQSCINYWVYDPLSQEPKLVPGWSSAQAEYNRMRAKESSIPLSPKSLEDMLIPSTIE